MKSNLPIVIRAIKLALLVDSEIKCDSNGEWWQPEGDYDVALDYPLSNEDVGQGVARGLLSKKEYGKYFTVAPTENLLKIAAYVRAVQAIREVDARWLFVDNADIHWGMTGEIRNEKARFAEEVAKYLSQNHKKIWWMLQWNRN